MAVRSGLVAGGRSARYLFVPAVLAVLLAALATLQYRWLGDVSAAERERLRATLRTRAAGFTADFDRAIGDLFTAFRIDPSDLDRDPAAALAAAYARASGAMPAAALVRRVYLVDPSAAGSSAPLALDVARAALVPATWPPELEKWRRTPEIVPAAPPGFPLLFANVIDASGPALVVHVPRDGAAARASDPPALARAVVVLLDRDALRMRLVEPLVARHFGSGTDADYFVTVAGRGAPAEIVYAPPSAPPMDESTADVVAPLFALRPEDVGVRDVAFSKLPERKERFAITIVRRSAADPVHVMERSDTGAWMLLIRFRAGSLEALVARSRRRNIAVSAGIVGLLAASFVLVLLSAERQRRLARQQIEFVAAVSHELRTPLAVICSAGENLADGVVADRAQVREYGTLVQHEGRRLADMVERILDFAGMAAAAPRRPHAEVDAAAIVAAAAAGVEAEASRRGVAVRFSAAPHLPRVSGDAEELRSAVQNVVGNAVKYSGEGGAVDVGVDACGERVRVRVVDNGIGIDSGDLPHVFEPFFRGRRAIDRQVRGAGIGLAIVRRVVDAHGGAVRIVSSAAGTAVTIELPSLPLETDARQPDVSHAS